MDVDVDDNVIYQGDIFKLSESRKRLIGSKSDTWKPKFLIVRIKGEKPVVEYHKKKPKKSKKHERTLTESFELWPTFKVEKLKDARGRAFVCEITSPELHLFLSANSEKEVDILVFLLQVQINLKDNIREDQISVMPDDSECQQKIGAKASRCILHASPWGLTLALEKTRALLAQWPLKSIRYYETSGSGLFNIEAGRVAPMGEGLYSFKTNRGDDDLMYDIVDNHIVNTLDRVKPTQKGTPEEIQDYMREHDCLHSLTTVKVCLRNTPEIRSILKTNWNIGSFVPADQDANSTTSSSGGQSSGRRSQHNSIESSPSLVRNGSSSHVTSGSSSLVVNLDRPRDRREERITDRPPPLPARTNNSGGVPRRSRRREHSIPRKVDVASKADSESQSMYLEGSPSPISSPRRHSNPSSVLHRVHPEAEQSATQLHIPAAVSQPSSPRYQNQAHLQNTHMYSPTSQNSRGRPSNSPMVNRNTNKVGRAEYLLNIQHSGVEPPCSPSSSRSDKWDIKSENMKEDDHQDAQDYLDAVAKASQQKYGAHNSIDRRWAKHQRELSNEGSVVFNGGEISPQISLFPSPNRGYANLSGGDQEIRHGRQRSADSISLSKGSPFFRQDSKDSSQGSALCPPSISHNRQRSADECSRTSFDSVDPRPTPEMRPRSAGSSRKNVDSFQHSRQNSVISTTSGHQSLTSEVSKGSQNSPESRRIQIDQQKGVDGPVGEWLMSASCEDLSDHMRTVIYDDSGSTYQGNAYEEIDGSKAERDSSQVPSPALPPSSEKPPLPFTGLKKFHDQTDNGSQRDRSKSFGYMNINSIASSASSKPASSAPSAHLIRKMVNARAKQDTLRKSLSNPNFLNLGSKEHLFNLKAPGAGKLTPTVKQKSRSFGSLFPAIKRAFSRESLGHSRSTTPERRASFSHKRRKSDPDAHLRRQSSLHSLGEMTIKGIRMTERSRSFRRVRGAKSVDTLSQTADGKREGNHRLSTDTTLSSPAEIAHSTNNRLSSVTTVSSPAGTLSSQVSHESSAETSQPHVNKSTVGKKPGVTHISSASMKKDPTMGTSVSTNPEYMESLYITLDTAEPTSRSSQPPNVPASRQSLSTISMSHLPPLPTPDQPPPLPAPRTKPVTEDEGSSSLGRLNKSSSSSSGFSDSPVHQAIYTNVTAPPNNADEPKKKKRPLVSDIVARIEENNNENKNQKDKDSHCRSSHRGSESARNSFSDNTTTEKPFQPLPFKRQQNSVKSLNKFSGLDHSETEA